MSENLNDETLTLTTSVDRLGSLAKQLADGLAAVDSNQRALLDIRKDVSDSRSAAALAAANAEAQRKIDRSRVLASLLVGAFMLVTIAVGALSYARIRGDANAARVASTSQFAASNRCQIGFNSKILTVLKTRGTLDARDQANLQLLLSKLAIPGTTYDQGQAFRRDYLAASLIVQAARDALAFPKTTC